MQQKSLFDFEPEKVLQREAKELEDKRVMDLLGRLNAEMLKTALLESGGHPVPEWGDTDGSWRYYYLRECERRGRKILADLGWPSDEDSLYVNLHTGTVETLWEIATWHGHFADKNTVDSQVWSVIEHWVPYDPKCPNMYLVNYLREEVSELRKIKKPDAYHKGKIASIPKCEAQIRRELSKAEAE